jgi:hypothetical protein
MEIHTFTAYGKTVQLAADTAFSVMEEANRQLLWSNPLSKDGAWFQDGSKPSWTWREGNYFD